jgi:hypothetical protein
MMETEPLHDLTLIQGKARAGDHGARGELVALVYDELRQFDEQGLDVVAVHEALDRLAEVDGQQAQVMTLRYFGRLTVPEVAAGLGVSV